jgi:2-polyprenyl-3-methyl-5-hydroxy-6-metoxy-1,4-benzoquinol methylase
VQHHPEIARNLIRRLPRSLSGKRVLDLGCGRGAWGFLARAWPGGTHAYIVGVDVYEPDVDFVRSLAIYDQVYLVDLSRLSGLEFDSDFDYVFAFEVIEHVPKRASTHLLDAIDSVARQAIFLSTPTGRSLRPPVDANTHSAHLCGWTAGELVSRGYRVEGLGLRLGPKDHQRRFWYLSHYGLTPVTRHLPGWSNTLFAYKEVRQPAAIDRRPGNPARMVRT